MVFHPKYSIINSMGLSLIIMCLKVNVSKTNEKHED